MDFTEAAIKIGASGQNQVILMRGYFVHQSIDYSTIEQFSDRGVGQLCTAKHS